MHVRLTLAIGALLAVGFGTIPPSVPAAPASTSLAGDHVARASSSAAADPVIRAATPAGIRSASGLGWYSSNWAGYALAAGPYRSVSGQWTVPTVSASRRSTYSAQWVGVDGVSSASLIQAGTQANFVNGAPRYSAWWEILPAPAVAIRTLTVRAGDVISVTIARVSAGRWRITLKDS